MMIAMAMVDMDGAAALAVPDRSPCVATATRVSGVAFRIMPSFHEPRGSLTVGEFSQVLPFEPKRYFIVYAVPFAEVRGGHAHRSGHQFLLCVSGSCRVLVDDGNQRETFLLASPDLGLHLAPMTWAAQYDFSSDAVLLVFASNAYDPGDYVRDYDEFLRQAQAEG